MKKTKRRKMKKRRKNTRRTNHTSKRRINMTPKRMTRIVTVSTTLFLAKLGNLEQVQPQQDL